MPSDPELTSDTGGESCTDLETLYRQHFYGCLALASRLLRDRQLAEDVLQEVFLDLWRRPEGYREDRGSMRNWLLTITHNKCIDRIRAQQRRPSSSCTDPAARLLSEPSSGVGPEDVAVRRDEASRVVAALRVLPSEQRRVLTMAYFGGYSQTEIAAITSVPLGTVKGRTAAGLRSLACTLRDLQPATNTGV